MRQLVLTCAVFGLILHSAPRTWATCVGGTPNGVLEAGEECDDNDTNNLNCCKNDCTNPCVSPNPCKQFKTCTNGGSGNHTCSFQNKPENTFCGDDGIFCTYDYCHNGQCHQHAQMNGQACDDGNACTHDETCSNGKCRNGIGTNCDDGHDCTADSCNVQTGACINTLMPVGPCDDGNLCTGTDANPDHCDGTSPDCIPGAGVSCDVDNDPCTTDPACDPDAGCAHPFVAAGTPCNASEAGGSDGNPCTSDTCGGAPRHDCVFTGLAQGTACATDTNECTIQTCQPNGGSYPVCTLTGCEAASHACVLCGTNCGQSLPYCGCANS